MAAIDPEDKRVQAERQARNYEIAEARRRLMKKNTSKYWAEVERQKELKRVASESLTELEVIVHAWVQSRACMLT